MLRLYIVTRQSHDKESVVDAFFYYQLVTEGTTHTYKIECKLYYEESGSVTVNDRTVIEK